MHIINCNTDNQNSNNAYLSDKRWLLACFLSSIIVYLFYTFDIFYPVGNIWYHSGSYNYSYIVFFISISWMLFNIANLFKVPALVVIPSIWSLVGIFICTVCALILYAAQLDLLLQIFMLILLWFIFCSCFGSDFAISNTSPFLLLLGVIPLFDFLVTYHIGFISYFIECNLAWIGKLKSINNHIIETDNILILTNKTYTGLRYLNVVFVISLLYGYFILNKLWTRFLYVVISLLITILVNLARVLILINYANSNGIEAVNNILYVSGWLFFLLILLFIIYVPFLLQFLDKDNYINVSNSNNVDLLYLSGSSRVLINACAVLVLLAVYNYFKDIYRNVIHSLPTANILSVPQLSHEWKSCLSCEYDIWYPKIGLPDAKLLVTYKKNNVNKSINFHISYYEHQYTGNSLINLDGKKDFDSLWFPRYINQKSLNISVVNRYRDIEKVKLTNVNVNRVILYGNNSKRIVWHWYWINGVTTNNKPYAKFLEIMDLLKTLKTHSALIAISAEFNDNNDLAEAEFALFDFMKDNYSYLYPNPKRQAVMV